ncbi:hypothetical protein [Clostridium manihotivorum]|uniref:SynChlorMet cassette protein ScmC n=1 Tax=Clostridium manihotivorum TaxID=2320868 RepID=A0A3R5U8A3_9CLOT|nr:hypothetical protein [Clostridium manihotivorum]QAA34511.1 hypothetical protein C1I91_24330 [Clostridium manihotivorum]
MQKISIADLKIEIDSNKTLQLEKFKPFECLDKQKPQIIVKVSASEYIPKPSGKVVLDEKIVWVKNEDGEQDTSVYICRKEPDDIAYLLSTNEQWSKANICYKQPEFDGESAATGPLGEILFRNRLLFNQGLVVHASAVEYDGKGIIFSAPSETGKTTQAKLWCEKMGAELINNDRPAIRIIDNKPYIYGTPWSGEPSECNNNSASLSAIIMLEQASKNYIVKLSTEEAVTRLMPRCFLPYYDRDLMNIAMNNLENLLRLVPVYLLKCKPDLEAVDLVYKTIWRDNK